MEKTTDQLILLNKDYNLLVAYLKSGMERSANDRQHAESLQAEIKKAKIVASDNFPSDVIRLNSTIRMKLEDKEEVMEVTLVAPGRSNIKEKKISVLAPIGTALIGFRQGQQVSWDTPAGMKTFTILQVINQQ